MLCTTLPAPAIYRHPWCVGMAWLAVVYTWGRCSLSGFVFGNKLQFAPRFGVLRRKQPRRPPACPTRPKITTHLRASIGHVRLATGIFCVVNAGAEMHHVLVAGRAQAQAPAPAPAPAPAQARNTHTRLLAHTHSLAFARAVASASDSWHTSPRLGANEKIASEPPATHPCVLPPRQFDTQWPALQCLQHLAPTAKWAPCSLGTGPHFPLCTFCTWCTSPPRAPRAAISSHTKTNFKADKAYVDVFLPVVFPITTSAAQQPFAVALTGPVTSLL